MIKNDAEFILKYAKKMKAISLLGGKCEICGKSNFIFLEFHHKDGERKEDNLSVLINGRWSKIENEIKKCILLCSNCHREKHSTERDAKKYKEIKAKLLEIKGVFCCERCGYGEDFASLDFHHRNSEKKDFALGNAYKFITKFMDKICEEIEKCDVICKNCHAVEHFDKKKFEMFQKEISNKIESFCEKRVVDCEKIKNLCEEGVSSKRIGIEMSLPKSTVSDCLKRLGLIASKERITERQEKVCKYCKNKFVTIGKYNIEHKDYCSAFCKQNDIKLKISKEELVILLENETYSSLSRRYNVAPNTVRNLAKRFGLIEGV
jgi:hypothetical protein